MQNQKKNMFHALLMTLLLISVGLQIATFSAFAADNKTGLQGEAFGNPDHKVKMPKQWQKQGITYIKNIKDADLVVSFGQQTYPALKNIVAEYAEENKLKIVIQSGTCGISAGKLLRKTIDAGAFCCPPGKSDRLPGLEFHTIAISPLVVIVHKDNPVSNITIDQARDIFRGKIRNWSELSGNQFNKKVLSIGRLHCKKRPGHWRLLLKDETLFGPELKEVGVIPDLISKVDFLPSAISLETPFMAQTFSKRKNVKALKIDNHAASEIDYVASGKYPLYRTYSITTWSNDNDKKTRTMALINYLKSYIEINYKQYNFVPVSKLKKAGWKFKGDELIGEPDGEQLLSPGVDHSAH